MGSWLERGWFSTCPKLKICIFVRLLYGAFCNQRTSRRWSSLALLGRIPIGYILQALGHRSRRTECTWFLELGVPGDLVCGVVHGWPSEEVGELGGLVYLVEAGGGLVEGKHGGRLELQ